MTETIAQPPDTARTGLDNYRKRLILGFSLFSIFFIFYVGTAVLQTPAFKTIATLSYLGMPLGLLLSLAIFLGCAGDIGVFGIDSIWLSIGFFGGYMAVLLVISHKLDVAWLVTLAFGIAASAIFPAMTANLWWKRATRQGILASIVVGLIVSVIFIYMLLTGQKTFLGLPTSGGPGIFGVTASIVVLVVVSLFTKDTGRNVEEFFGLAHKTDHD